MIFEICDRLGVQICDHDHPTAVWFRSFELKHYLHGSAERVVPTPRSDGGSTVRDWSVVGTPAEAEEPPSVRAEEPSDKEAGSGGASHSGSTGGSVSPALLRWARFVRAFWHVRKLQRYFHNTGERLKDFKKHTRDRVAVAYPKQ